MKLPNCKHVHAAPLDAFVDLHYNSLYDAAKQNRCNETTLRKYANTGALVDENGRVWIKGKIKLGDKG